MTSIKTLLGSANSALMAQKSHMHLIGKNVSNANTPGYSRQRAELTPAFGGFGVTQGQITSARAELLQRSILGVEHSLGFQQGRAEVLDLAELGLNDLDGDGVSSAMDEFFMAVSQLSGNPAGLVERSSMLSASKSLAQSIRRAAGALDEARSAAEADARLVVDQINTHTAEIALLNDQIHELEGVKQPVGELVDRRDALLKQLANNVDIRVVSKDNGMVSVFLEGSGDALIEGPIVGKLEVTGGGPVAIDMTIRKPSGTVISISNPTGGRLGGLLSARDTTLQTASDQLDLMAFTLIDEVNNAHQAGFDLAGNPGTAFFTPVGGVAGAARAIALSATVDGQPENIAASSDPAMVPGDDGAITAILALQDGSIVPGGKTLHEGYEAAVFTVSSALSDAKFRVKAETGRAADLAQARASVAGVSLHEEMASLSQAERAFQASARVVQTADQLYETLLQMV